jgi:DNA polymerase ligase (LigD)-like protein
MPRFVVLEHDHPELHWDLMLEGDGVLRTWRLLSPPDPGQVIRAAASFDHRLLYLEYEGPVSGGRGSVKRWDAGTFSLEGDTGERLVVVFEGSRLQGRRCLQRLAEGVWVLTAQEDGSEGGQGQQGSGHQPGDEPA